ncbi:conserved hypothetical protein [Sporisorium reilianum SRZ2]|uniref:DUF1349 domain-containing protein n=1 Tax=Sporisorium reilianum (strain SRZ2) TaxID=999809 RepID=E6ZS37_SPORE|nr:conserved hypothetical protein [Sporisorium reilianum SRZ2]
MTTTSSEWSFHDPSSTSSYTITPTAPYTIRITSGARTDWWTTAPLSSPESSAHRTSGPVVYRTLHLAPSADWKLSGTVQQSGTERFQQSTLFIRRCASGKHVGDVEAQAWLKAGIENEGGRKYVGVVASAPYSDWNVSPLPAASASVRIEIEKRGPDVHVYYTLAASTERLLLREKKGFAVPLSDADEQWWLGAMVCGPLSERTQGVVDDWTFERLPADDAGSH